MKTRSWHRNEDGSQPIEGNILEKVGEKEEREKRGKKKGGWKGERRGGERKEGSYDGGL